MNQPVAMGKNLNQFLQSLEPLLDAEGVAALRAIGRDYTQLSQDFMNRMWSRKLGVSSWERRGEGGGEGGQALWRGLEPLLRQTGVDWTLFWRQLAEVAALPESRSDSYRLALLQQSFYGQLTQSLEERWAGWLQRWLAQIQAEGAATAQGREAVAARMRQASPKYVPREWMLAEAYTAAGEGDHSVVHRLQELFRRPYDEQPEFEARYYRLAEESASAQGGIGFMS